MLIDTDGHIMEPPSMWFDHIESQYQENCVRVERRASEGDQLIINGKPSARVRRLGGVLPTADGEIPDWNSLEARSFYESYLDSCLPASYSPNERLKWMDDGGVSATLLFPSLGLLWPQEIPSANDYVRAHMWAYNRWIMNFCQTDRSRLIPVAQCCLYDTEKLVSDLVRLERAGFKHIMLPWMSPGAESCFSGKYSAIWAKIEELELTIHLHKIGIPNQLNLMDVGQFGIPGNGRLFEHINQTLAGQECLASIFDNRLPDLFPRLKLAFHECNAGWVAPWLDRADESYHTLRGGKVTLTKCAPSEYVLNRDSFFFGMSTSESIDNVLPVLNRVMVATDYPHPGSARQPAAQWSAKLSSLMESARAALLEGNALRLLNGSV